MKTILRIAFDGFCFFLLLLAGAIAIDLYAQLFRGVA